MEGILNSIMGTQPRGLYNFISELRKVGSKEEELMRVDKELGNIRQKFSQSSSLTAYQKKKYVWKLCYIYMLGYEVDFGHVEFISLLGASLYSDKSVGYLACSLLLRPDDDLMSLVINSVRNDLVSSVVHCKTLALAAISSIGGKGFAENLSSDVQEIILKHMEEGVALQTMPGVSSSVTMSQEEQMRHRNNVLKKSCLCLLRLYRTNSECVDVTTWVQPFAELLREQDPGVLTSAMSLLTAFASHNTEVFEALMPAVVAVLTRLVTDNICPPDYQYYRIPCPWLQIKCLRFLQYYKEPEGSQWSILNAVLLRLLTRGEGDEESVNIQNIHYALVFEAIALVVSWGAASGGQDHHDLRQMTHKLLGKYTSVNDANVKYLALNSLVMVCKVDGASDMQKYQDAVISSLNDADMSVRRRALEVVYLLTDESNSVTVVAELITALVSAEAEMREEMVVKIAILSERFHPTQSIRWYIDTMIEVIIVAGNHVAEAVWYRIVRTVINNPDVHEYAAQKLFQAVQSKFVHEVAVCLAGYLLGEIGFTICDKAECSGADQFDALKQHFEILSQPAKAILLTSFSKMMNQYPNIADEVKIIFDKHSSSAVLELQQRACEYINLPDQGADYMAGVLESMPTYADDKESQLHVITDKHTDKDTSDKAAWKISKNDKEASRRASIAGNGSPPSIGGNVAVDVGGKTGNTPPGKAARPVSVDLLSMNDAAGTEGVFHSPASSGFGAHQSPMSPDEVKNIQKLFYRAVVAGPIKSTLFENDVVNIACLAEFKAHQSRMAITIYNKSDFDINNVVVDVQTNIPGEYLEVRTQPPMANKIGAMDELRMQVAVECKKPFDGTFESAPQLNVRCSSTGDRNFNLPLRLPLTPLSFSAPMATDKETYMQRWKLLEGDLQQYPRRQVQEIFASAFPVNEVLLAKLRANLIPKINIGLAAGLDGPATITGCCSFRMGSLGPDGNPTAVGAMVRLEADPGNNKWRITVRAKHEDISRACVNVLKGQLEEK